MHPIRHLLAQLVWIGLFVAVFIGGFSSSSFGQSATGALTGTVTDPKGLAMAGASVVVHNADTGVDMKPVTTNDSGIYTVPSLQPGNYDVTASQTGFASVQHKGVTVQVGSTVRIDIEMPVASQQSLVTVTTEVPLLETEKTEQSQNVSENLVSNLPISSRRWEQFVFLTPGVAADGANGQVAFHGLNSGYNNNSVDGANNNSNYNSNARGGTNDGYVYSGDSIREFQVSSSGFQAELGQAAGGAVNAVTRSGTNLLHGDLFYNGRSNAFNAIDPVAKADAATKGVKPTQSIHQQHQYGGSVGGPLVKDKLLFFATYDAYRKVTPIAYTSDNTPVNLPCPTATGITQAQCTAAVNWFQTNNLGFFPRLLRQDVELVKLDYQLNVSHHLSAVTNIRDWKEPNGTAFASANNSGVTTEGTNYIQDRFIIASWNMVIGNNKVNEFRYQWGRDKNFNPIAGNPTPAISLSSISTYYYSNGSSYTDETRHQIADNFSFTKGSHAFKVGVDINLIRDIARSASNSAGSYTYNTTGPNATGCATSGAARTWCNWLVDLYGLNVGDSRTGQHWTTYTQVKDEVELGGPPSTFRYDFYDHDWAFFLQDTWKPRPNLTINAGVRYDVQGLPQPPHPATELYGAAIATTAPLLAYYTSSIPIDYTAFQPRLGIAWNFAKKSVLRVGGGIFYGKTSGSTFKTIIAGSGESNINCKTSTTSTAISCLGNLHFPDVLFNQQDVVPGTLPLAGARQPLVLNPSAAACPSPTCGTRGIDPAAQRPRVYQAQMAIEQQLPGNINFSASYIFTRGVKLPTHVDTNIKQTSIFKSYDVVDANGVTQLSTSVPLFYSRANTATGPVIAEFSRVNSMYHGLVLTARKPMSRGVELLVNYTLSKATDNGQAGVGIGDIRFQAIDGVLDKFNYHGEEGFSSTDARNRFTTSVVWQPALGKNLSGKTTRMLLDGWTVSTAVTATNGTRYNGQVQSNSSPSVTISGVTYTGLQGGMTGALISTGGSAIGGRISWFPRNNFVLPNLYNVDLRVSKQFNITERMNLELRGELFNLLNSTLVLAVSTSAYTYANPSGSTGSCPLTGTNAHANTCMIPVSSFQRPSTTSGNLFGARQAQAGLRFNF